MKNKIITFFVCLSFFYSIFSPIRSLMSGGEAFFMLLPSVMIFLFDKMFLKLRTIWFMGIVLIIALLNYIGVPYFRGWIPEIITLSFGYFGLEHYLQIKDEFYAKWVLRVTYITLVGLVAISLPQFIAMPNLTRMIDAAAKDPTIEFEYYWTVNYNTVHFIPIASIPLFVCYKRASTRWRKNLYGISASLMTLIMMFADATIPLIIMTIIVGFFLLYNSKQQTSVNILKLLFLVIIVLPFLNETVMVTTLRTVKPIFKGSSTYGKIDQITYYIERGESYGDMNARENLYNITIDAILTNPLSPEMSKDKIGKHSHILDHMAAMGLLLFIPYALLLYYRYKRPMPYLHKNRIFQKIAFCAFMMLAFSKNSFPFNVTCFLVPMFLIYIENSKSIIK